MTLPYHVVAFGDVRLHQVQTDLGKVRPAPAARGARPAPAPPPGAFRKRLTALRRAGVPRRPPPRPPQDLTARPPAGVCARSCS